jgi:hypothetical protein
MELREEFKEAVDDYLEAYAESTSHRKSPTPAS